MAKKRTTTKSSARKSRAASARATKPAQPQPEQVAPRLAKGPRKIADPRLPSLIKDFRNAERDYPRARSVLMLATVEGVDAEAIKLAQLSICGALSSSTWPGGLRTAMRVDKAESCDSSSWQDTPHVTVLIGCEDALARYREIAADACRILRQTFPVIGDVAQPSSHTLARAMHFIAAETVVGLDFNMDRMQIIPSLHGPIATKSDDSCEPNSFTRLNLFRPTRKLLELINGTKREKHRSDQGQPSFCVAGGVSLLDAAMVLSDDDEGLAKQTKDRWARERTPKPQSIGICPFHRQVKLYAPSAIAGFVEKIEGERRCRKSELLKRLALKARQPREK